jgi:malonyl-CoA/methylmalonyl-CoA synthetase
MNFYDLMRQRFLSFGGATAVESPGGRYLGFVELDVVVRLLAWRLAKLGVAQGERVVALVDSSAEAICLYLGTLCAGGVYVPLNPALTPRELEGLLADAEPRLVVCAPALEAAVTTLVAARPGARVLTLDENGGGTLLKWAGSGMSRVVAETDDAALAALVYTSGTTGKPKGAMITHANLAANALALVDAWGFGPGDALLDALPLFHVHGLFVACHCALLSGARLLLQRRFVVRDVLDALPRVTAMMGVPTYYTRLLGSGELTAERCAGVRLFTSGSAPLRAETFRAFEARTGHRIVERYGMTETLITTTNPFDGERRPGSVGRPLRGTEARVVDGELEVRGPSVFKGYWRQPEATAAAFRPDGFFRTGDLARIDDDGYVTLLGRSTDVIITGGENVAPAEVEAALEELGLAGEAAVIGLPHPDLGEAVTAVVVARDGAEPDEAGALARLRTVLAGHKVPKRLIVVDQLPRNAMGKVEKAALRERFRGLHEGRGGEGAGGG